VVGRITPTQEQKVRPTIRFLFQAFYVGRPMAREANGNRTEQN
jgi:hypothetical protein